MGPLHPLSCRICCIHNPGITEPLGAQMVSGRWCTALVMWIQSDWWRVSAGCYGSRSLATFFVWAGVVIPMFMHHVIQRSHKIYSPGSPSSNALLLAPPLALTYKCIWPALTFMPIAWSILNAFRPFNCEPDFTERAIIAIQSCISWGTIGLAVISIALCFGLFVIWARRSMVA